MQQVINPFDILAVSDFIKSKTQRIPVSVAYLRTALQQITSYFQMISLADVSQQFKHQLERSLNSIKTVAERSLIPLSMLLVAYEHLHILIILILLHYYLFVASVCADTALKLQQCLVCINAGDIHTGVGMCESILPIVNA